MLRLKLHQRNKGPYSNGFRAYSIEYASDSRFKVQGKLLPGSEAYSIEYALNPIEYPVGGSGARVLYFARKLGFTGTLPEPKNPRHSEVRKVWVQGHPKYPHLPKAEI